MFLSVGFVRWFFGRWFLCVGFCALVLVRLSCPSVFGLRFLSVGFFPLVSLLVSSFVTLTALVYSSFCRCGPFVGFGGVCLCDPSVGLVVFGLAVGMVVSSVGPVQYFGPNKSIDGIFGS